MISAPARVAALSSLLALALSSCATVIARGALPRGAVVEELGPSDPGTPFAADPAGRRLALVRSGELVLVDGGGAVKRLGGLPRAIAFSAGSRLAASFPAGPDSELRLYSPDGALEATARVPGALSSLAWLSDGEVAGGAATLERFSFGATRTEHLVRWTGKGEPSLVQTGSTTVKPLTMARDGALAERGPGLSASPLGDEVCLTQLHDPPAFPQFSVLLLRNLDSGATRELGRQPWGFAGAAWADDGDALWLGDGSSTRLFHWTGRQLTRLASPGRSVAVSPRGTWVLADGRVFEGGAERIALQPDAEGLFTARGLLVRSAGRLHLLASFAEDRRPVLPDEAARLRELRRLRAQGLITPVDYERLSRGAP